MLAEKNAASVEVLLYWVDNYLLNDNVGPFEKRLFDWWIGEGFFCVSNFKNTDTGVSAELILLLGDSIYDIIRSLENDNSKYSLNDADTVASVALSEGALNPFMATRDSYSPFLSTQTAQA